MAQMKDRLKEGESTEPERRLFSIYLDLASEGEEAATTKTKAFPTVEHHDKCTLTVILVDLDPTSSIDETKDMSRTCRNLIGMANSALYHLSLCLF